MRSVLALILQICGCATVAAATVRHDRPHHYGVVRPGEDEAVPPGWYRFPGYPPIPPSENRNLDPSNFGGG
jgi:hypothetical protein